MKEVKGFISIIPKETIVLEREYVKKFKFCVSSGKESLELAAGTKDEMCKWAVMVLRVSMREVGPEFDEKYGIFGADFGQEDDSSIMDMDMSADDIASAIRFDDENESESSVQSEQDGKEEARDDKGVISSTDVEVTVEESVKEVEETPATVEEKEPEPELLYERDEALSGIQSELTALFSLANNGKPFDETRLLELFTIIQSNPAHKAFDDKDWWCYRKEVQDYTTECLKTQQGLVPPHIFQSSLISLIDNDNIRKVLAKRFMTNKSIWLVRVSKSDISRIHHHELISTYMI